MPRWYFKSYLTSAVITLLVVVLANLAAFGFSRMAFGGKRLLFLPMIADLPQVGRLDLIAREASEPRRVLSSVRPVQRASCGAGAKTTSDYSLTGEG